MPAIIPAPGASPSIHAVGGELADLEEGRAGIEQPLDPVARQQFAARDVALAMLFRSAQRRFCHACAKLVRKRAIVRGEAATGLRSFVDLADDLGHPLCTGFLRIRYR